MTSTTISPTSVASVMRPPDQVMSLDRMGASFQTRLSFMRNLVRKMAREQWRFECLRFNINELGYGHSVYAVHTPERTYSLVAFTNEITPEQRSDRVVAEAWDATFNLFDGVPTEADIQRLAKNTPKQEAGRYQSSELVLARANKSVRLFEHVVSCLAAGKQPDIDTVAPVGYVFRTTAVYGSGKFGCADRSKIADRPEIQGAFQVELLTVYLIRWFVIDLIEHVARERGGSTAVSLAPELQNFLGIGNSTGLGMAPFLVKYQVLVHTWVNARETALARVRCVESSTPGTRKHFQRVLAQAIRHAGEWEVDDRQQTIRIKKLRSDLEELSIWCENEENLRQSRPWNALFEYVQAHFSLQGQELAISLLLEPHGELVDDLAETLYASSKAQLEPAMRIARLKDLIRDLYHWALEIDFSNPDSQRHFWYYSEDKIEPRLGNRATDIGVDFEMPLAIGRDVSQLFQALQEVSGEQSVGTFVLAHPEFRYVIRRIQTTSHFCYAEIRDNLVGATLLPLNLLRFKLSFFGASKFDPKSDLWTRINMYQGAPLPNQLAHCDPDDWAFPLIPRKEEI